MASRRGDSNNNSNSNSNSTSNGNSNRNSNSKRERARSAPAGRPNAFLRGQTTNTTLYHMLGLYAFCTYVYIYIYIHIYIYMMYISERPEQTKQHYILQNISSVR